MAILEWQQTFDGNQTVPSLVQQKKIGEVFSRRMGDALQSDRVNVDPDGDKARLMLRPDSRHISRNALRIILVDGDIEPQPKNATLTLYAHGVLGFPTSAYDLIDGSVLRTDGDAASLLLVGDLPDRAENNALSTAAGFVGQPIDWPELDELMKVFDLSHPIPW